jgi:hypothetical protein
VSIKPYTVSGEKLSVKNFAENISEKNDILNFQLVDVMGMEKIRISLPGAITYYGGNVTVIDKDTFEIAPTTVSAEITRNDPNTLASIITNEDIQIFVGYVAFQKGISPLAIVAIVLGGMTIVGLTAFALYYFYQRGKRLQMQEDCEKELENERKSY